MIGSAIRVLVIAPPGPWREGLCVLLKASRRVAAMDVVGEIASGQLLFLKTPPDLVLLDASLPGMEKDEILTPLIKGMQGCPCLVLTHSAIHEQMAQASGAWVILPEGFSTETFFNVLDDLTRKHALAQ